MTSREKLIELKGWLQSLKPEGEEQALQLQWIAGLLPLAWKMLPADPAEIDRYLRIGAWGMTRCRSDEAPRLALFELVEGRPGEPPEWKEVDIELSA